MAICQAPTPRCLSTFRVWLARNCVGPRADSIGNSPLYMNTQPVILTLFHPPPLPHQTRMSPTTQKQKKIYVCTRKLLSQLILCLTLSSLLSLLLFPLFYWSHDGLYIISVRLRLVEVVLAILEPSSPSIVAWSLLGLVQTARCLR